MRSLLREGFAVVGACDEVGRGCLAGPVTLGVVVIDASTPTAPQGVADSKLLSASRREELLPRIQRWAVATGVGHASAAEIDEFGLTACLRLAGHRALASLPVQPEVVLLDGNVDYLSPPVQDSLFGTPEPQVQVVPAVRTLVKADMTCAATAAASIVAKTARDALMADLAVLCPEYDWSTNKGYGTPEHLAALRRLGPSPYHRTSWNLPPRTT